MESEAKFNLQSFLSDMRREQREDHAELSGKVDTIVTTIGQHETRIVVVENTRKLLMWLGASFGVAVIGFLIDMVVNHLKGVGQ